MLINQSLRSDSDDNSIVDSDQDKCNLFNKFFTRGFTKEDHTLVPHCLATGITITPGYKVFDKLIQLNPNKAPGPEMLIIVLLKRS